MPDVRRPHFQPTTNHQSTQLSPAIIGGRGHFKLPYSAHAWWEDACAGWLHNSTILGWAALGEAAKTMQKLLTKQQIGCNLANTNLSDFGK